MCIFSCNIPGLHFVRCGIYYRHSESCESSLWN
nr:MAG TPA: hypothetical protein [Caudoviricetes sp.]